MSPSAEFLDHLRRYAHVPELERVNATIEFEVTGDGPAEHRLVRIDHGDIEVSSEHAPADCVIGAHRAVFDEIVSGRTSVMAALLRGDLSVDGDPVLMVLSRRLFLATAEPGGTETGRAS